MARIIRFDEIQAARERDRRQLRDRASLESAIAVLKENLVAAANLLRIAPASEQAELLTRIERLTAMIRYGLHMLGDPSGFDSDPATRRSTP
jgi:hypothetical protein